MTAQSGIDRKVCHIHLVGDKMKSLNTDIFIPLLFKNAFVDQKRVIAVLTRKTADDDSGTEFKSCVISDKQRTVQFVSSRFFKADRAAPVEILLQNKSVLFRTIRRI